MRLTTSTPTCLDTATPSPRARGLLAAALLAASCVAAPALAQGTGMGSGTGTGTGTGTGMGRAGATAPGVTTGNPSGNASQLQRADQKMIDDIAQANLAEIEASRIALDTSKDERVRKFAQTMIDEHTAALAEVRQLAQAKGVTLPDGPDIKHKAMATALKAMSGDTFDRQYMSQTGVKDHQATLELLKRTQREAKDPQLKALAAKMVPVVQGHLDQAHHTAPAAKR